MDINSTSVLHKLESMADDNGENSEIDINVLANSLGITVNKVVALLTELEHRDEIKFEISSTGEDNSGQQYTGKVRLMRTPLDEMSTLVRSIK